MSAESPRRNTPAEPPPLVRAAHWGQRRHSASLRTRGGNRASPLAAAPCSRAAAGGKPRPPAIPRPSARPGRALRWRAASRRFHVRRPRGAVRARRGQSEAPTTHPGEVGAVGPGDAATVAAGWGGWRRRWCLPRPPPAAWAPRCLSCWCSSTCSTKVRGGGGVRASGGCEGERGSCGPAQGWRWGGGYCFPPRPTGAWDKRGCRWARGGELAADRPSSFRALAVTVRPVGVSARAVVQPLEPGPRCRGRAERCRCGRGLAAGSQRARAGGRPRGTSWRGECFWKGYEEEGGSELPPHRGCCEECVARAPPLPLPCAALSGVWGGSVCVCLVFLGLLTVPAAQSEALETSGCPRVQLCDSVGQFPTGLKFLTSVLILCGFQVHRLFRSLSTATAIVSAARLRNSTRLLTVVLHLFMFLFCCLFFPFF